jgi:NAD(P)-dependent dehydrogenase (short-subunit alcohol dehydrogenase family)
MELKNRVALVTGGSMGIGAAIAIDLAKLGAKVAICARNLGDEAQETKRQIEAHGSSCLLMQADMTKAADCVSVVEQTASHFGRLDVIVNNAGGPSHGRLEDVSAEQWLETMNLHVNSNFYIAKAALPHLKKQKEGAYITVASSAAIRGINGAIAYATAKGAIPQFTRCLAREWADFNIRVNCIAPGIIRTRFHHDMPEDRKKNNLDNRIPLHREGTIEQVAEAVRLLITNDYITGETLVIDGGLTSRIT